LWWDWQSAVQTASNWDRADPSEKSDLIHEWSLMLDFLVRVSEHEARGELTPAQEVRFDELRCFIREHATLIEGILGVGAVPLHHTELLAETD